MEGICLVAVDKCWACYYGFWCSSSSIDHCFGIVSVLHVHKQGMAGVRSHVK